MDNVMACRVCLATDVKLYDMYKYNLFDHYQLLTGIQLSYSSPHIYHLCSYCAALIIKSMKFRSKCLHSQEILSQAERLTLITTEYIRRLDKDPTLLHPYSISTNIDNCFEFNDVHYCEELPVEKIEDAFSTTNLSVTFINDETVKDEPMDFVADENGMSCELKNTEEVHFEEVNGISHLSSDEEPLSKKAEKRKKSVVKKKKKRHKDNENSVIRNENSLNKDVAVAFTDFDKCFMEDGENGIDEEPTTDLVEEPDNFFSDEVEVVVLTKQEQIDEIESRKLSRNYLHSAYKCDKCYKGFMSDVTFNNHVVKHQPSSGPYECEICLTRWPDARSLRAHVTTTHERKYICKRCRHVSKSSHRAREHSKWHDGFQYICKICGAMFSKSTSHLTHVRLRHPSGAPCPVCGEFFLGRYGLNMHKKKAHPHYKDSPLKSDRVCGTCHIEFKSVQALEAHRTSYSDSVCDSTFRPCIFCGWKMSSDQSLAQHIREQHRSDKAITCQECGRHFANARTYAVHRQHAHCPPEEQGHVRKKKADSLSQALVCETCGLVARSRASLIYHQRAHTGEKPYQCTDCPKRFTILQRLQIHRRTHTGERPFQCTHCPKAFKQKAALNRHDRVHSGVKPYECRRCGKRFSQSNSMKLHERAVHLKMPSRRTQLLDESLL